MLGILGGMGPAATVDLMRHIVALTPAQNDTDHVPLVVSSDGRIPSLGRAILEDGESPVPAMISRIRMLESAGVERIAIACHAAFHWYDDLSHATHVPIIHIADAVCEALADRVRPGASVGLLAAASTLKSGFYRRKLLERNFACALLDERDNEQYVFEGIKRVKRNDLDHAAALFDRAISTLIDRGASVVVLACTEIPVALAKHPSSENKMCVDGTQALAKACVDWWTHRATHTRSSTTAQAGSTS